MSSRRSAFDAARNANDTPVPSSERENVRQGGVSPMIARISRSIPDNPKGPDPILPQGDPAGDANRFSPPRQDSEDRTIRLSSNGTNASVAAQNRGQSDEVFAVFRRGEPPRRRPRTRGRPAPRSISMCVPLVRPVVRDRSPALGVESPGGSPPPGPPHPPRSQMGERRLSSQLRTLSLACCLRVVPSLKPTMHEYD